MVATVPGTNLSLFFAVMLESVTFSALVLKYFAFCFLKIIGIPYSSFWDILGQSASYFVILTESGYFLSLNQW